MEALERHARQYIERLLMSVMVKAGDAYAVSLWVYEEGDHPAHATARVGFNTETRVLERIPSAASEKEARWDFRFWLQNELGALCDPHSDPAGAKLRAAWIRAEAPNFDDLTDLKSITRQFLGMLERVVLGLHRDDVVERVFGRPIPVLIHELDYYRDIAELNQRANPNGLADDFADWVRRGSDRPQRRLLDDLGRPFQSGETPGLLLRAAKSYAGGLGLYLQEGLDAMNFQDAAHPILEYAEAALEDQAAGHWFSATSDVICRLVIGVAGAGDPPAGERVQRARAIVGDAHMLGCCDFVPMNVTEAAAETEAQRLSETFASLAQHIGIAPFLDIDTPAWRIQITISPAPTQAELELANRVARKARIPAIINHWEYVGGGPARIDPGM